MLRYMVMKTHWVAQLIATKRYPRNVSFNVDIAGLKCFQATVLKCVILGFTVTMRSQTMPTQTMI